MSCRALVPIFIIWLNLLSSVKRVFHLFRNVSDKFLPKTVWYTWYRRAYTHISQPKSHICIPALRHGSFSMLSQNIFRRRNTFNFTHFFNSKEVWATFIDIWIRTGSIIRQTTKRSIRAKFNWNLKFNCQMTRKRFWKFNH